MRQSLISQSLICLALSTPAFSQALSPECSTTLSDTRITLAVAGGAGGGLDTYARAAVPAMERFSGSAIRVANLAGGGGELAMRQAASSEGSQIVLLVEDGVNLATTVQAETGESWAAAFDALGFFHRDPGVWVGRKGLSLQPPADGSSLVAAVATIEHEFYSIALPAEALGLTVDYVAGYDASGDLVAAVLRDEGDFATMSLSSALRAVEDPALAILMVLSDAPHPEAPDAPHLAGPDGLASGSEDSRALADTAASLTTVSRGIFAASSLDAPLRACLRSLVDLALNDPEVKRQTEAQGRPLQPVTGEAASAVMAQMVESHRQAGTLADD